MGASSSAEKFGGSIADRFGTQFWLTPARTCFVTGAITFVFFIADVLMPRGATVAIGYCLVPAIAAGSRSRRFPLALTIICTVLTWIAFFAEPPGYSGWKSAFDRTMVTAVIWFALFLVARRSSLIRALLQQTQALKEATQELERSNGELANFASVVAHDLRGPLNTEGLFAQLLSNSSAIKTDPEGIEHLASIRTELTRMSEFIESLLTYGRIGSGELRLQACDCAAIMNNVRQNLKADLEHSGAEVSNEPLPLIYADPTLLTQLFQNLVENSMKYRSDAAPRIHIAAVEHADVWQFSVQDNGVGVRAEDAERIFKPFYQTTGGKVKKKGVGLGLATCKKIVERHGGHLELQPNSVAGANFTFTIPREPSR
jgi:signal transduction histidine kinase